MENNQITTSLNFSAHKSLSFGLITNSQKIEEPEDCLINKAMINLGNVDNTSDINKLISKLFFIAIFIEKLLHGFKFIYVF